MKGDLIMATGMYYRALLENSNLSLAQIEARIALFPEWLDYYLTEKYLKPIRPKTILDFFKEHGMLFKDRSVGVELMDFDKWLIFTGRQPLAINKFDQPVVGINVFNQKLLNDLVNLKP